MIESYFFRTLATHAAMGAEHLPTIDWVAAAIPDLAVELTVDERVRRQRLAARARIRAADGWLEQEERNVGATRRVYDSFRITKVDTTGLTPHQVVDRLDGLIRSCVVQHG